MGWQLIGLQLFGWQIWERLILQGNFFISKQFFLQKWVRSYLLICSFHIWKKSNIKSNMYQGLSLAFLVGGVGGIVGFLKIRTNKWVSSSLIITFWIPNLVFAKFLVGKFLERTIFWDGKFWEIQHFCRENFVMANFWKMIYFMENFGMTTYWITTFWMANLGNANFAREFFY